MPSYQLKLFHCFHLHISETTVKTTVPSRQTVWGSHHTDACFTQLISHALMGIAGSQCWAKLAWLNKIGSSSPLSSPTPLGWSVGGQGECVWLHTSHRQDQGVQCELEFSRPAQRRGARWDQRQTGWVCTRSIWCTFFKIFFCYLV